MQGPRRTSPWGLFLLFTLGGCAQAGGGHTLRASALERHLPAILVQEKFAGLEPWQWLGLLAGGVLAFLLGWLLERVVLGLAMRVAGLTHFTWDDNLILAARGSLRLLVFAALWAALTRWIGLSAGGQDASDLLSRSVVIVSGAWFCLRLLRLVSEWVQARAVGDSPQALGRLRGLRTQVIVFRRVLEVAVVVVASALFLMQFQLVRTVGVSLLASAGIAGLVLGLAAQKSIGSLLAGIQLSITQPVRLGDTVIVEGEYGVVEELSLTYVVVRVWDARRLIIPIGNFLDQPFQNWSRVPESMLGTVELRVDFSADPEAFRQELGRLLSTEGAKLWDGKVQGVQVTDTSERTMLLRILVSADPSKLFDLRCLLRERLIAFLKARPDWMPLTRNENRVLDAGSVVSDKVR